MSDKPTARSMFGEAMAVFFLILFAVGILWGLHYLAQQDEERKAAIKRARSEMREILESKEEFEKATAGTVIDPWEKPYTTRIISGAKEGVGIASAGPDGKFGTRDDITDKIAVVNWTNTGEVIGKHAGRMGRGLGTVVIKSTET